MKNASGLPKWARELFTCSSPGCGRFLCKTPTGYWACPLGHGRLIPCYLLLDRAESLAKHRRNVARSRWTGRGLFERFKRATASPLVAAATRSSPSRVQQTMFG